MIRFVQVINKTDRNPRLERVSVPQFELSEVWINEKYVVQVRPHTGYDRLLKEGRMGLGLDSNHRFSAVIMNEGGVASTRVVIGIPSEVANRLMSDKTQLLKG